MKLLPKLEFHYHFDEEETSHSMDAFIRNKCENELLQIINTISKDLGFDTKTETEAYKEGGLKEIYSFISSTEGQAILSLSNFLITIAGIAISRIPLKKTKLDRTEQELSIKEKELNIEVQKLNLELLKKELESKNIQLPNITIEKINYTINNNVKLIKHKSNFYKTLHSYPKVKKIETVILNSYIEKVEEPIIVHRKDFYKYFLDSDNLDPIIDENATIEIISPVLIKTAMKYKWRGIYISAKKPIEFNMKDQLFKDDVIREEVTFKSGTFIDCVLEIERKIDDLGNIYNSNYSVVTVLKQHTDGKSFETEQGKKFRQQKEADKAQYKLFDSDGKNI